MKFLKIKTEDGLRYVNLSNVDFTFSFRTNKETGNLEYIPALVVHESDGMEHHLSDIFYDEDGVDLERTISLFERMIDLIAQHPAGIVCFSEVEEMALKVLKGRELCEEIIEDQKDDKPIL